MQSYFLPSEHFDIVRVSGADASRFLQGQLTCDVEALDAARFAPGAICNTKGRVVATFNIAVSDAGYLLILPAGLGARFIDWLKKYLPFYKCAMEKEEALACIGLAGPLAAEALAVSFGTPPDSGGCLQLEEGLLLALENDPGRYLLCAPDAVRDKTLAAAGADLLQDDGRLWRISSMHAGHYPFEANDSELFTPQHLHLDRRDYVSFSKGCYTGQEIVARMHYRGKAKKQLYLVTTVAEQEKTPETLALLNESGIEVAVCSKLTAGPEGTLHGLAELPVETPEQQLKTSLDTPASVRVL